MKKMNKDSSLNKLTTTFNNKKNGNNYFKRSFASGKKKQSVSQVKRSFVAIFRAQP